MSLKNVAVSDLSPEALNYRILKKVSLRTSYSVEINAFGACLYSDLS